MIAQQALLSAVPSLSWGSSLSRRKVVVLWQFIHEDMKTQTDQATCLKLRSFSCQDRNIQLQVWISKADLSQLLAPLRKSVVNGEPSYGRELTPGSPIPHASAPMPQPLCSSPQGPTPMPSPHVLIPMPQPRPQSFITRIAVVTTNPNPIQPTKWQLERDL